MGRQTEFPRYNVISMRVSDAECESLKRAAAELSISISDMMRRILHHLTREHGF